MPHFRVDDAFHSHPKAQRVGDDAIGLWTRAGSYCMAYLTDGFVPEWWVKQQQNGTRKAKKLVAVGLWYADEEKDGEKGYQFHDFLGPGRQDSREKIEKDRELARRRKERSRLTSQQESQRDTETERPENSSNQAGFDGGSDEKTLTNRRRTEVANGNQSESEPASNDAGNEGAGTMPTSGNTSMSRRDSHRDTPRDEHRESQRNPGYTQPNPTQPLYPVGTSGGNGTKADAHDPNSPPPARCPAHTNVPKPPDCGACADARRALDAWNLDRRRADQERARAELAARAEQSASRALAIAECELCDDDGYRDGRVCHHNPDQADTNARGAAAVRAALAAAKGADQ